MINFFEYMHLFLISAQVMEMIEKNKEILFMKYSSLKEKPPLGLKACGGGEFCNYAQSLLYEMYNKM